MKKPKILSRNNDLKQSNASLKINAHKYSKEKLVIKNHEIDFKSQSNKVPFKVRAKLKLKQLWESVKGIFITALSTALIFQLKTLILDALSNSSDTLMVIIKLIQKWFTK